MGPGGGGRADTESTPKNATHWSTREIASVSGLSQSPVSRIWRTFGLKPHLADTFKLSKDPQFIEKVRKVGGLYLDPPERAIVLCVDEKSQAPVLPMRPGMPERRTHDYLRGGVTTLFAALNAATGEVISSLHRRHRAVEFKKFLAKLDKEVPDHLDVHINQVERGSVLLTDKQVRRGVHRNARALEKDIRAWIADWNDNPRPFVWKKTADKIFERLTDIWTESQTQDTSRRLRRLGPSPASL